MKQNVKAGIIPTVKKLGDKFPAKSKGERGWTKQKDCSIKKWGKAKRRGLGGRCEKRKEKCIKC